MPAESKAIPEREQLLDELVTAYLRAVTAGQTPDRQELLTRHPDLAAELAEFFADQDDVQRWATPLRMVAALQAEGALGDFRIIREIGRGGMGVVYEALQISLGRRVALKVLPFAAALDSKQLQRFKNEAQAAAGLQHTNIVPVYFVGCERGVHFYAMQFVEGQTLAALIQDLRRLEGREGEGREGEARREGETPAEPLEKEARQGTPAYPPRSPEGLASELVSGRWAPAPQGPPDSSPTGSYFPSAALDQTPQAVTVTPPVGALSTKHSTGRPAFFRTVANLGIQAAEALEHAHQLGVIHRDIKPANLMVDGRGNLWITDFGLAHCQKQAGLTMSGDLVGTLRYMSPEQTFAKRVLVDHRTDIYSLGVTLYELLTLEPAFGGKDREELLRQIAFEEPRGPRRLNRAIPAELETIILKAIENNPADRYSTAQDFADDFRRYLENRPIRARRPSILAQLRKWSWRHRAVVTAAVVATVLALALTSGLTAWQWRLAVNAKEAEKRGAEAERQAKDEAQAREAETKAVLDFVENNVFAAARLKAQGGLGHDVTLRKAVEAALPFVKKSFTEQPLIEARLRLTLGLSFLDLGEAEIAAEQFQAARTICTKHLGPDHDSTLANMNNLASSYEALGRHADALELREETLALRKAKLGPDHPDTLGSMNNLACSYDALGRYADALKLREETLALQKTVLGSDQLATLGSQVNLANSYAHLGRHTEAIKLYEETLAGLKAKFPDREFTFTCMEALGVSYGALGRHADALKLNEETLALRKAKLAPDHPHTLMSMMNLATNYDALGRHADALKLHEETLALRKAKLGPDHPETLMSIWGIAYSLVQLDRGAEAVPVIDECVRRATGKIVDPRMVPEVMDLRLRHFEKINDAAGCKQTAEMWEKLNRADADGLYNAACFRAATAAVLKLSPDADATRLANEQADHAVAWLKQAVAAGFKDAAHMKKDKDLDALRQREDFKRLLGDLEK